MAGYLFGIGSDEKTKNSKKALQEAERARLKYTRSGVFSVFMPDFKKEGQWDAPHEGTFADFVTMKENDNIYFFHDRKVYGIGKLTNIDNDCKFLNFPNSNEPKEYEYEDIKESLLYDFESKHSPRSRFICTFAPDPFFFTEGVDMDDLLKSDPDKFKMLRAFWKLSFIKFDDLENQAFRDVILNKNKVSISVGGSSIIDTSERSVTHNEILKKVTSGNYSLDAKPFLRTIYNPNGSIRHEMAIEAEILSLLSSGNEEAIEIFGRWDYLTHQVIASPFKPIEYMDKIDIFGYSYMTDLFPTVSNFLVVEIKKDKAVKKDLLQLMKYVDWVKEEYAHRDYSRISAFLVAFDFEPSLISELKDLSTRNYIVGYREPENMGWNNVKLVSYAYSDIDHSLIFSEVE